MMSEPKAGQWAWAPYLEYEVWEGPFDTREEAEAFGRRTVEESMDPADDPGWVTPARWPDPAEAVQNLFYDVGDILQKMDEWAHDNAWYDGDDELFVLRAGSGEEQEEELRALLGKWAAAHVRPAVFSVDEDEAVRVPREP